MTMQARHRLPVLVAFSSLVFEAAVLACEYFNGGVPSHHLLDRPDFPAISNWFGLAVLPLLGWLLGVRLRNHLTASTGSGLARGMWAGLVCSLLYGAAMATLFQLGMSAVLSGLFFGLFLLAALFPVYRVEYIFGFVVGMTFTFGTVLPTLVAVVFAAVSVVVHFVFRAALSAIRSAGRKAPTDRPFKQTR
ncbi:hypothetical protein ACFPPA_09145 [Rhodanobacter ginsengisoli]|uniref:Uncharacterized protein n=1 Tax=Rhodanobacter ginsengisoli TaxID=418646 RepID=A0ABW0QLR1_9GAMM